MSNFAKANKTAQWFQDDYPGAVLDLSAETMVLTIHTTEGLTWPGYGGGETAPNYTGFPPLEGISSGQWRAHFPDERSSRALRNLSGGVQTNTLNTVQVELIGTCDPRHAKSWNGEGRKVAGKHYVYWPNASDEQLAWLADLVADMHRRHDLRLTAPAFKAYPGSYGAGNGVRFSFDKWRSFAGICGHQHVPENLHGDPGNINIAKIITFAKEMLAPPPPPPVTTHTRWATRTTGVHETPGGTKLRDIPAGYKFQVIDGSGHGNDGWIETAAGNWVLGADTTTRDPALPATLKVMTWNVKTNRSWTGAVLPELLPVLDKHKPDVVCLQECYDAPDLVGMVPGYTFRYQGFGYPPKTVGYIEERSEQIILVRDGVEVKVSAALEMVIPWKGPVVGAWHDPRVHRRVTVSKDGVNWRVVDFHGPFGDALGESNAAMLNCLQTFPDNEPVIIVGDWNQSNSAVVTRVGAPGGAVVDGGGIDLAVYRDCKKVSGQNLTNFGSDHPIKVWVFEA